MKKLLLPFLVLCALVGPILYHTGAEATVGTCATPCRMDTVGNGASTSFAYTFKIQANTHLAVYVDGVLKTLTTDYTVTGVGNPGGGTVVFSVAPANGAKVAILRAVPASQETDYIEGDPFPAQSHEDAMDKLTMMHQEQEEKLNRAIKLPVESTLDNVNTPTPEAEKCIAWNASANGLQNKDCSGGGGGGGGSGDITDVNGTANEITVTNPTGPAPTVSLPSTISIPSKTLQLGRVELIGDISPVQITGTTNDYNPASLATASTLRLSTDASRDLTGLAGGSDGRILTLHNIGTQNLVLKDESLSSSAANRFALNADLTISGDQSVTLQYDATSSRWRVLSSTSSGSIDQSATYTWTGTHTFSQIMNLGASSPAQITANQNNYAIGSTIVQRLSTDASRNITGIVAPSGFRLVFIANVGSFDLVLKNEDAASSAANRFTTIYGADITVSDGEMALLIYDVTSARWRAFPMTAFVRVEVQTLDNVFDLGKVIDGANSFANGFRVTDSSGDGVVIYRSAGSGPVVTCVISTVENDCDKLVKLNAGKKWEIQDDAGGAIVTVTEAGATTYGSSYLPKKSVAIPAGAASTDGTQCANPAEVTINSGAKRFTIICTDNDAATIYFEVPMPDSWNGGTVTVMGLFVQTAADTNNLNADIAAACRRDGDAINNTWGTEVAMDTAMAGSNALDTVTTAAITPNGTCTGGSTLLQFRWQLDAAGTTTAVATLHVLGFKVEYSVNNLSD